MAGKRGSVAGIGLMGIKRKRGNTEGFMGKNGMLRVDPEVIEPVFAGEENPENSHLYCLNFREGENQGRQKFANCSEQIKNIQAGEKGDRVRIERPERSGEQRKPLNREKGGWSLEYRSISHQPIDTANEGVEVSVEQDEGGALPGGGSTLWGISLGSTGLKQTGVSNPSKGGDRDRANIVCGNNPSGSGAALSLDFMDPSEIVGTSKLEDSTDSLITVVREISDHRESSKAWLWTDGWSGNWGEMNMHTQQASTSDVNSGTTISQCHGKVVNGTAAPDPDFCPQKINLNPKARKSTKFQVLTKPRRSGTRRSGTRRSGTRGSSRVGVNCVRLSGKSMKRRESRYLTPDLIEPTAQAPIKSVSNKCEILQVSPVTGTSLNVDAKQQKNATTQHLRVIKILQIALNTPESINLQAKNLAKDGVIAYFASVLGKADKVFAVLYSYILLAWVKRNIDIDLFAGKEIMETVRLLLIKGHDLDSEMAGIPELNNEIFLDTIKPTASRNFFEVIKRNLLLSLVPNSETQCSSSMALAALRLLIDNNSSSSSLEALKESMRMNGVLDAICDQMVFSWHQCSRSLASPTLRDVSPLQRCMWKVQTCLDLLCCMTNASDPSQKHILQKLVEPARDEDKVLFPAYVASQFSDLRPQFPVLASAREHGIQSLQGLLGLLMNLGHRSGDCMEVLVEQGVVEACVDLMVFCCGGGPKDIPEGCQPAQKTDEHSSKPISDARLNDIRDRIVANASSMECMLGLLINVCEGSSVNRQNLISIEFPNRAPLNQHINGGVLELLSCMLLALGFWRNSAEPRAVTMEDLDRRDKLKAGDLVKMCTGVLLGYLIEDNIHLQKSVAGYLFKKTLQPVVKQVKLMLKCCTSSLSPVTSCDQAGLERIIKKLA